MAIQWKDIIKYGGTGLVSLAFVLVGILNLSGISYSADGDKTCTDCYSEIRVNSTYWEIKVEHNKDNPIIRKKTVYGRTLWLNLDRINEIVTTNPEVKVDLFIPTNRINLTEINNEYGRLRSLKDGDILIARGSVNRIILHGNNVSTIVKWSFDVNSVYMKDISIDPIWFGINITPIQDCIIKQIFNKIHIKSICFDTTENNNFTPAIITLKNYSCITGSYIDIINTSVCRTIGLQINNRKIEWEKNNWNCKRDLLKVSCDAQFQSNFNGICTSGERCVEFNLGNLSKRTESGYSPTKAIKRLEVE